MLIIIQQYHQTIKINVIFCGRDTNNGYVLQRRNACSNKDIDSATNAALYSNIGMHSISNGIVKRQNALGDAINEEYYKNGDSRFIDETTHHAVMSINDI